ncbi:hypothetical protein V8F33_007437 [Rhypophila sp. PSN 637]
MQFILEIIALWILRPYPCSTGELISAIIQSAKSKLSKANKTGFLQTAANSMTKKPCRDHQKLEGFPLPRGTWHESLSCNCGNG